MERLTLSCIRPFRSIHPKDPIVLKSVPAMLGVDEGDKPKCLQIHSYCEASMEAQPVDVLMAAVGSGTGKVFLRHHAAHLLDRYARKYKLTPSDWQEVLRRCNLAPTAGLAPDGTFNMLALDDNDLRRVYLTTPNHYDAIATGHKKKRGRPSGGESASKMRVPPGSGSSNRDV